MKSQSTNLARDIRVRESHDETVFRRSVLVLILYDQPFTGEVVGFTFASPFEFNLVPFEILLIFYDFDETLRV